MGRSQRAFRRRREQHAQELEHSNKGLKDSLATVRVDYLALKHKYLRTQISNKVLSSVLLSTLSSSQMGSNESLLHTLGAEQEHSITKDPGQFVLLSDVWKMTRIKQALVEDTIDLGQFSARLVNEIVLSNMIVSIRKDEVIKIIDELETRSTLCER